MGAHNRLVVSGLEMLFQIAVWVGESMGKTTAEVLADAAADARARAADSSDETETVGAAIDADMPGDPEPPSVSNPDTSPTHTDLMVPPETIPDGSSDR